jgi:hypothetical protein
MPCIAFLDDMVIFKISKMTSSSHGTSREESGQTPAADFRFYPWDAMPRSAILWGPLCLAAYAVARSLAYAGIKPLSIDEVVTQAICRQPNLQTIWQALSQGADGQPPLFYVIERSVAWLVPNEHIGYRLLSTLGFACTLTLLYVFVKTRNGTAPALVCASLLLATPLFTIYAAEARPYSLLTAFVAIALVCYQRAPTPLWVAGMFISLFFACSIHYYAVFSLFPFFLAELTVVYQGKEIRLWVWVALLAAPIPLAISWPLLMQMKHLWAAHFFVAFSLRTLPLVYGWYFGELPAWGTALAGAAFVTVLATFSKTSQPGDPKVSPEKSASERVLVLGFILLPMLGYAVAKITHGPFVDRYFLPAILGIAAAVGYALGRVKPRGTMVAVIFVLLVIGVQELGFWTSNRHHVVPAEQISPLASFADDVRRVDLPIVVSDFGIYLESWHYAPPGLRRRIMALADPASAVKYIGTDTSDQLAVALRPYVPVAVQDFAPFAAEHPVFLLYSTGSLFDWWPARLTHEGARLQLLAVHGPAAMYLVELKVPAAD